MNYYTVKQMKLKVKIKETELILLTLEPLACCLRLKATTLFPLLPIIIIFYFFKSINPDKMNCKTCLYNQ